MRIGFVLCVVAFALVAASASAQEQRILVAPPSSERRMPEDGVADAEKLPFLATYIESDAPLQERRWALNRAMRLVAQRGDAAAREDWADREAAFYHREAARIDVAALPVAAKPCDVRPDAESTLPHCGPRVIDYETGAKYEIVAEAARRDGNHGLEIALRESAAIFMGGASPHSTYWTNLAARAADAGEDASARRVCGYLHATQYRSPGPYGWASEEGCQAQAAFKAGRWADWIALRQPAFAATPPTDAEALLRYCIAFTRTGAGADARVACDRAGQAVAAHGARFAEAAARPDRDTLSMVVAGAAFAGRGNPSDTIMDEALRQEAQTGVRPALVDVVSTIWAGERPRLDAAIAACGRGADAEACAFPDNIRTLAVTFRSRAETLSDLRELIGKSR